MTRPEPSSSALADKRLFLLDLDGVLYAGKERVRLISGRRLITALRNTGKSVMVLTNTSTHRRPEIQARLRTVGIRMPLDSIWPATTLTAQYLSERWKSVRCFLIGERGFRAELEAWGHRVVEDEAEAVVVGLDRRLTYRRLDAAVRQLRDGARLIASHMARLFWYETGPAVAVGPIVRGLEYASGRRAIAIGKPAPYMFRAVMRAAGAKPSETVMVGDQLETDVVGAQRLGIYTVLVLSGVETQQSLRAASVHPQLVVAAADDLLAHL